MIVFLVGYAGSGKSSLGKRLARRLGVRFVDTDKLVEESVGASIPDIFHYEGEEYFRIAERRAVESLANEGMDLVVATGGGLPTWRDNMEWLVRSGVTIYLRRTPEQILSRLSPYGRQKRPKFRGLNDEELLSYMRANLAEREPVYERATVTVDCSKVGDDEIVAMLSGFLLKNEGSEQK
jgi:shikimate kinase